MGNKIQEKAKIIVSLELIRGIASLIVFIHHFGMLGGNSLQLLHGLTGEFISSLLFYIGMWGHVAVIILGLA